MPYRARVPYYGLVDWTRQIVDRHATVVREQGDARQLWASFENHWCRSCGRQTQHIVTDYYDNDSGQRDRIVRCFRCPVDG